MEENAKNLIAPGGVLLLAPVSLLIGMAVSPAGVVMPLLAVVITIVIFNAIREWRKRRTHPEQPIDPYWGISHFLILVCCPGLGWLALWIARFLPDGTPLVLYGTLMLVAGPLLGVWTFYDRMRKYRDKRRAFEATAPKIHIDLTGFEDAIGQAEPRDEEKRLSSKEMKEIER